jgi:two-component system sensor histidine kinase PilS (NtrC family)
VRLRPGTAGILVGALAARLLAIGGTFALAVVAELTGSAWSERTLTALYALVLAGFLSTLVQGLLAAAGRVRALGWLELVGDGLLVTALVWCTGGARSLFGFLYIAWIVYAAVRSGSLGVALAPVAATAGYVGVALGLAWGWLPALEPDAGASPREAAWASLTHAAAFLLVALLASRLAREVTRGRERLHELGEIHRRIVENVSSGLIAVDAHGRIALFNPEAARICGLRAQEVLGRPLAQLFPSLGATAGATEDGDARAGRGVPVSRLQLDFENRAGEKLELGLSRSILRDSAGEPDGSVLIFQDLTHVMRMEDQLRRSQRLAAVGQLAAGLAHEIRNPLASLSGSIELLERELPELDGDARRLVGIVRRETARLNRLVVDFLAYARPGPPRRERVRLFELIGEVADLAARGEQGLRVEVACPPELELEADPDQLRQLLWNLVRNAIEAGPQDGAVRLRVALAAAGAVEIEVADRGAGIAPEILDRIFEPFFTTKAAGTGLGLATVHRIAEAHAGSLEVASEPGRGTRVVVRLPGAPPVKRAPDGADAAAGESSWRAS